MMKNKKILIYSMIGLWVLIIAMIGFMRISPVYTEKVYSQTLFPLLSSLLGTFTSALPFSLIECIYLLLLFIVPIFLGKSIYHLIKQRDTTLLLKMIFGTSVVLVGFVVLCMPNYYRLPLESQLPYATAQYTTEQLYDCATAMVDKANLYSDKVTRDEKGQFLLTDGISDTSQKALRYFNEYTQQHTKLPAVSVPPKPLLFSMVMSHLQLTGFTSPFTAEPSVNVISPHLNLPATMCHELAHTAGIMREEEANFLAYLSCRESDDVTFQYSGYLLAVTHLQNALYRQDPEQFRRLSKTYGDTLKKDMDDISNYWNQFEGVAADLSEAVNNTYLKLNDQTEGIQSYGMVVDLIVSEYLSHEQ